VKQVFTTLLLFIHLFVLSQNNTNRTVLQTNNKTHLYYVDLNDADGKVYALGSYLDKAGTGYSLVATDTVERQPDGSYAGKDVQIVSENERLYLVTASNNGKRFSLAPVKSLDITNNKLNNAYYLDHYFQMSEELNKAYPLYQHSFRNGFSSWKKLQNKEITHEQFRGFVDQHLQKFKDSIVQAQNRYVVLTNYIISNLKTFDYTPLRDSLVKLPAEYKYQSWYFGTVINEVSKQRPEYFFRLAEDFPANRSLIFGAVEDNKEVIRELKLVEGHDQIKKEFFKERRSDKTMLYKIIGAYAMIGGLIALLIAQ